MREAFRTAVATLGAGESITLVGLTAGEALSIVITLDGAGVPQPSEQLITGMPGELSLPEPTGRLYVVNTAPDAPGAVAIFDRLRTAHPDARCWDQEGLDVRGLARDAIADSPVRLSHGLLVARADPRTGQIMLALRELFPEGARRGAVAEVRVRSEAADDHGTVLAVVAWDGSAPALLSMQVAHVPPGPHLVRVRLRRPGSVLFLSPEQVTRDNRSVAELMAAIPRSYEPVQQHVHLVCAIEIAGPAARVAARLDCAEKLVKAAHRGFPRPGALSVGLMGYGAHHPTRRRRGDRVIVTDWLADPEEALKSLGWFGAAESGHPRAVQLEDMLAEVVARLDAGPRPRRTTLLVIGERPPHPPGPGGDVAPCPHGHDWQRLLSRLERQQDVTLAAIRDQPGSPGGAVWARLGTAALKPLATVDAEALCAQIGLSSLKRPKIPVPLID
ncbi:hypothetical protein ABGB14_43585 [Nonomuraea sp. B10E15]|uniref:hypothetical protein n=1 Tax=Nonomuraea sp. B10E15 TaxID=3153560 RepID=UPI00325DCEEC